MADKAFPRTAAPTCFLFQRSHLPPLHPLWDHTNASLVSTTCTKAFTRLSTAVLDMRVIFFYLRENTCTYHAVDFSHRRFYHHTRVRVRFFLFRLPWAVSCSFPDIICVSLRSGPLKLLRPGQRQGYDASSPARTSTPSQHVRYFLNI